MSIIWEVDKGFSLGPITLRYYTLGFILSFFLGMRIMKRIFVEEEVDLKKLDKLMTYVILSTILGARLGHVFFYGWDYYQHHLIEIILPFRFSPFEFTGFQGLASHGAAIGILIGIYYYAKNVSKTSMLWVLDRLVITVALAAGFIRLGNLMNSEIIGAPTDMPWGFQFLKAGYLADPTIPRHPTQIYESVAYFITFIILFQLYKKAGQYRKEGFLFGLFLVLLFGFRFVVEFFKEVQESFEQTMLLNMGQILSIPFVLAGVYFINKAKKK